MYGNGKILRLNLMRYATDNTISYTNAQMYKSVRSFLIFILFQFSLFYYSSLFLFYLVFSYMKAFLFPASV